MFTTGSKLFLGATAASTVGALVWGACNGGAAGVAGVVGLAALAIAFAFLAGMNLFTRDGNVLTNTPNPEAAGAAQRAGGNSMWPLVTAIGVGGLVIGAVSRPVVFKVSVVVLLAALAEWMIQGFAERASADANCPAAMMPSVPTNNVRRSMRVVSHATRGEPKQRMTAPKVTNRASATTLS